MPVYPTSANLTSPIWPAPIERIWQILLPNEDRHPRWKRSNLGVSDRLFIGAILNQPVEKRPWGVVQWLAEVYQTSRPTLYAIGARTKAGLLAPWLAPVERAGQKAAALEPEEAQQVRVTRNRIQRTALTLLFPGGRQNDRQPIACKPPWMWSARPPSCRVCCTQPDSGPGKSCSRQTTQR